MIDANIPLAVQSPKPIDPLAAFASVASLRGQMSEIALRQAQAETARQNAQDIAAQAVQRNRDNADQNTLQALEKDPAAYSDIHSGDSAKIQKRLGGMVQPKTVSAVQDYVNKQIEQKATLDTTTLKNQSEAHAEISKTVDSLDQMRKSDGTLDFDRINAQLPNAITSLAPQLRVIGSDPAQIGKSIHTEDEFNQLKARIAGLGALQTAALTRKGDQAKAAQAEGAAAKDQADADKAITERENLIAGKPKLEADAALAQFNAEFAKTHGGLTPDQLKTTSETERHNKREEANQGGELALKQKQFDATFGAGLDANGQPLSPEAMKTAALQDPTAQAIAHYQIAPPPATTRGGVESPIWRKILAINPSYKPGEFPSRSKVAQDFSAAGASGKIITAADTGLAHLDTVAKAGEALDNGDIQVLNRLANAVGAQTGSSPKVVYDQIVKMVAPEVSKAVIGAAGGEGERQDMAKSFSSDVNQKTRRDTIAATVGLLSQRLHKQAQAYESSMETPLDLTKRLTPESQAVMAKYGGSAAGNSSTHKVGDTVKIGGKTVKITAIHNDGTFDGDEVGK